MAGRGFAACPSNSGCVARNESISSLSMDATQASPPAPDVVSRAAKRTFEVALPLLLAVTIAGFSGRSTVSCPAQKVACGTVPEDIGTISFDALLPVAPSMRWLNEWGALGQLALDKSFGMYFALPFGAAMMTLLARTSRTKRFQPSRRQRPVRSRGRRADGSLFELCDSDRSRPPGLRSQHAHDLVAAMISSPSFNPIVIAMVLTLFPRGWQWPGCCFLRPFACPAVPGPRASFRPSSHRKSWVASKRRQSGSLRRG